MFGLFGRRSRDSDVVKPHADRPVYAVGDIHGRLDLLEPLVEKIMMDAVSNEGAGAPVPELIIMGDMIDRGPDSHGVLEFLTVLATWPEVTPIFLMGNHEAMLLEFLDDPVANKRWLRYGGYETLVSYQLQNLGDLFDDDNLPSVARHLSQALGPHLDLLEQCVFSHRNGNLLFAHAGAAPDVAPEDQPADALIWGTDAFMKRGRSDGIWVVHGHTVVEEPVVKQSRISIDTGAYMTGALTALKADGPALSFLRQTHAKG